MDYKENYIEDVLKQHFQKDMSLLIDNLEYKSGKFILYKFTLYSNNYYIDLHIQTNKKIDVCKIPYPFSIEEYPEDDLLYFDYRIKTFCKNNIESMKKVESFANLQPDIKYNKFYNKILEIKFS